MLKDELSNLQGQLAIARKAVLSSSRAERAEKEADVVRIENELGKVRTRKEREGRERREREALTGWKREERNKREEGKGAWHLKEGEKKRILAEAKHKALLEQGGQFAVKKSLDKKLKKVRRREDS
jgi:ribosomal RNA-processing protein 36